MIWSQWDYPCYEWREIVYWFIPEVKVYHLNGAYENLRQVAVIFNDKCLQVCESLCVWEKKRERACARERGVWVCV